MSHLGDDDKNSGNQGDKLDPGLRIVMIITLAVLLWCIIIWLGKMLLGLLGV